MIDAVVALDRIHQQRVSESERQHARLDLIQLLGRVHPRIGAAVQGRVTGVYGVLAWRWVRTSRLPHAGILHLDQFPIGNRQNLRERRLQRWNRSR